MPRESAADPGRLKDRETLTFFRETDLYGDDCCTRAVTETISECLMNRPSCCHALRFGDSYFCNHPRHCALRVPVDRTRNRRTP